MTSNTTSNSAIDDSELDTQLERRLKALTQSAEVNQAIWPKVEHRLQARSHRGWMAGAAAAACLLIVIVLSNNAPNWSEVHRNETFQAEVKAMNAASLLPQLVAQIDWSDDMRTAWNQYQSAIDDLEQALAVNPGYQMLMDNLANTRLKQSQLLNQAQSTRFIQTPQIQTSETGADHYDI